MKFASILDSISKKLDKFYSSETLSEKNLRLTKRIKSLEKEVLSQGRLSVSDYAKLAEAVCVNNFDISDKAISNSFRSRVRNKKEFYPIAQLLARANDNDIIFGNKVEDFTWLHEAMQIHFQENPYPEMYFDFLTFIDEIRTDLESKRIIRSLQYLKSKTNKRFKISIQIPIIASFLEFFDQVFTLKDHEIDYNDFHNSFNINVKTNNYYYGREIYGFIPIIS